MLYVAGIEMVHVLLKLLLKITGYQIFSVKKYVMFVTAIISCSPIT